jgi:hypothetical protein
LVIYESKVFRVFFEIVFSRIEKFARMRANVRYEIALQYFRKSLMPKFVVMLWIELEGIKPVFSEPI